MGLRQRIWARKKRDKIIQILGGKCVKCGTTENLEFDVIIPIGDDDGTGKSKHHRKMEWSHRMSFYRRQLEANNLQLLCGKHNNEKQNQFELNANLAEPNPF